jgi:hypothetical protein
MIQEQISGHSGKQTKLCRRLGCKSPEDVPHGNSGNKSDILEKIALFPPLKGNPVIFIPMSHMPAKYQLYLGQLSLPGGKR